MRRVCTSGFSSMVRPTGMAVDNPFEGQGTLTRVVADVRLHGVRS